MQSVDDITKVFGMTMNQVRGFSDLTEKDQAIFKQGILRFLNSYGLGNRINHLPVKVWKEHDEFRFSTLCGNHEEHMDSKGNIL